tara:strand:+ start:632 stop:796 length:165 start_codon:yes stop_codon:yes gene_type:complete
MPQIMRVAFNPVSQVRSYGNRSAMPVKTAEAAIQPSHRAIAYSNRTRNAPANRP